MNVGGGGGGGEYSCHYHAFKKYRTPALENQTISYLFDLTYLGPLQYTCETEDMAT